MMAVSISSETAADLAKRFGTPFFLYDADIVVGRVARLRTAMRNRVKIYYAVKANPNVELLRAILGAVDGLDISSVGELEQARLADFDAANVSFAGPAKTREELATSIDRGVGIISVESIRELSACADVARERGIAANIALRVNPLALNRSFGIKMGGRAVQFGIDEEELAGALDLVKRHSDVLSFRGMHIYAGSQCFDAAGIVEGVDNTLRIAREIETRSGLVCNTINVGGGFGISHGDDRELDVDSLADGLAPILERFVAAHGERNIIFELGRYLVARAGIYVTRVIGEKTSRGRKFYVVDGGLHHHLAAAGTFGAALRTNFALANLTQPNAQTTRCTIAGPSCNPTDLLGVDVDVARPQCGDLLAVLNAGSYGLTASPVLFLGRPLPPELVRTGRDIALARRARLVADFN